MNVRFLRAACFALLLAPNLARADSPVKFTVDSAHSTLTYQVVHPFHEVEGKTPSVEGVALVKPEGGAQVQIKADVRSFDSGNSNRDDHMKECVEASKFPFVTIKGVLKDFKLPGTYPSDATVSLDGELQFHGQKHPITIPATLHFDSAAHASVKSAFDVSLDAYGVERPSLMLRKIDDACHIAVDLNLVAK